MATRRSARKKTARKPRYHQGGLRQGLLEASLALIEEEGFGALTLREVARRAGVTHAAPYRHFVDKEALLGAVAEEGFRAMTARMRERMAREATPEGRLTACCVAYVLFAMEHPSHFRVMFGPHFTRPPLDLAAPGADTNAFDLLTDALSESQKAGVVREDEPRRLALTCWSLVHGLASLLVDRQLEPSGISTPAQAEALAEEQTRLLLRGMARAP
jgi:AcrR family transcriptional regulator